VQRKRTNRRVGRWNAVRLDEGAKLDGAVAGFETDITFRFYKEGHITDWRLEIGEWRLESGDWGFEIGDLRFEI